MPILGFHSDMVWRSKAYPVPKCPRQPVLERFDRVLDYNPSGRPVDDPTIRYSRSARYNSEGCYEIFLCDFHSAFRPLNDPSTSQGKFDSVFANHDDTEEFL